MKICFFRQEYRERIHKALSMGIEALRQEIIYEKWKCIELLSELRDGYDCFEENEPYYRALSEGIKAIRKQMAKAEIKPQESEGKG